LKETLPMFANEQMRMGALTMAAVFGGPGVFYAIESFADARNGVTAIVYLVIATALALAADQKSAPTMPGGGMLRRCRAMIPTSRRRRS
jgi:hypothetical protein